MADEMKKITLTKVKDEAIGAVLLAAGFTGGSVAMKFANGKVPSPWITPAVAFVLGFGLRLVDNQTIKDIGSGIMAAGAADGLKKGLTYAATKVPSLQPVSDSIPALSGVGDFPIVPQSLRGMYAPAQVVQPSVAMLR